jgi:flagellar basal-body rod protein FlgG
MNVSMYPLSGAMVNQLNRLDMISNNIANANTTGYKAQNMTEISFNQYLTRTLQNKQTPDILNKIVNTIPHLDKKYRDMRLGAISITGNKLDFAINKEDVYFQVQDQKGNIYLSKDGAFKNLNGMLVNKNGFKVLSQSGDGVEAIEGFEKNISLVSINSNDIENLGNNTYKILNNSSLQTIENSNNILVQGAIEKSNVNMVRSMVDLIEAQRAFERMQKAITSVDDINGKLIQKLGSA